MGDALRDNRTTFYIAFGGGLYWAASMLILTRWKAPGREIGVFSFEALVFFALVAVVGLLTLISKRFARRGFQAGLAISGIVATASILVLSELQLPDTPQVAALRALLLGCYHAGFILFWGLNYAVLSKANAEKAVMLSIIVSFSLYMVGCAIPVGDLGFLINGVMKTLAVVPFLAGRYELPVIERDIIPENIRLLKPFFFSRAFFGFCLAPLFYLPMVTSTELPEASLVVSSLAAAAIVSVAVPILRSDFLLSSVLRIAPIAFVGLLMLPYLFGPEGLSAFPFIAVAAVWISWIVLSSVQLSDLKERVGLNEVILSFSEKAVVFAACLGGFLVTHLMYTHVESSAILYQQLVPTMCVYTSMLVACFLFSNLIDKKQRQNLVNKALKLSNNQVKLVHEGLAEEFHLTEREREVLALIANGHTRPHVCKELVISDGTAKTHIAHIYEKLDIHSREELYAIVDERKKQFSNLDHDL